MAGMVVDASLAIAWVHPAQASPSTDALLTDVGRGTPVIVPALWFVEVANALLALERRKKLRTEERLTALAALRDLNISVDQEMSALAFTQVSVLASELTLSVYDAVYLELALRLKMPLACKDGPLREAAKRRRVKVLP
ncbi:MAG: type II toxin-antitoxin system VapC family toxin [Gemmatimonas sp.]